MYHDSKLAALLLAMHLLLHHLACSDRLVKTVWSKNRYITRQELLTCCDSTRTVEHAFYNFLQQDAAVWCWCSSLQYWRQIAAFQRQFRSCRCQSILTPQLICTSCWTSASALTCAAQMPGYFCSRNCTVAFVVETSAWWTASYSSATSCTSIMMLQTAVYLLAPSVCQFATSTSSWTVLRDQSSPKEPRLAME